MNLRLRSELSAICSLPLTLFLIIFFWTCLPLCLFLSLPFSLCISLSLYLPIYTSLYISLPFSLHLYRPLSPSLSLSMPLCEYPYLSPYIFTALSLSIYISLYISLPFSLHLCHPLSLSPAFSLLRENSILQVTPLSCSPLSIFNSTCLPSPDSHSSFPLPFYFTQSPFISLTPVNLLSPVTYSSSRPPLEFTTENKMFPLCLWSFNPFFWHSSWLHPSVHPSSLIYRVVSPNRPFYIHASFLPSSNSLGSR